MYPINLLNYVSVIRNTGEDAYKTYYQQITKTEYGLKKEEVSALIELSELLGTDDFEIYSDFYINYIIPHISKEFDLLRIGENYIVNIEIKSIYKSDDIISSQIAKNRFYLNALGKEIRFYAFVLENKKLYQVGDELIVSDFASLKNDLKHQCHLFQGDINDQFKPSKYLISPLTASPQFINNQYFLTNKQLEIKKKIMKQCQKHDKYQLLLIQGDPGTGKTLLLYDIVKGLQNTAIIHCGNLNDGHHYLNSQGWQIFPAKHYEKAMDERYHVIAIDEGQRLDFRQLSRIITFAKEKNITLIVSCDPRQVLNISEKNTYTIEKYMAEKKCLYHLTSGVRSNKEIYSFIRNMFDLKDKAKIKENYDAIKLSYFQNEDDAIMFLKYLQKNDWTFINYTTSLSKMDSFDLFDQISTKNAHKVLGQEFEKVAFVLDGHFQYEDHKLTAKKRDTAYDDLSMLYQIVTRAVNSLSVVVYDNVELFEQLVHIKNHN